MCIFFIVILFSSCAGTKALPQLYVSISLENSMAQRIQAIQGTTSWEVRTVFSHTLTESDSVHPLQLWDDALKAATLQLKNGESEMVFQFSTPPIAIAAWRWDAKYIGISDVDAATFELLNVEACGRAIIIVDDGNDYIYEVSATWSQGFSFFSFLILSQQIDGSETEAE